MNLSAMRSWLIYWTQEIVLDFFFDLFNIKTPKWYQTFIDGRRLTSGPVTTHDFTQLSDRIFSSVPKIRGAH
jgi:hypothetical protein